MLGRFVIGKLDHRSRPEVPSSGALVVQYLVPAHGRQIDALEQPMQLLHGQFDHALFLARPGR